jgi:hypothetical protein
VVFANPEVVGRVNEEFIPVALKAAMVNNPPSGIEGDLYAEIGRSKPAPQGICTTNSSGKVLAWALSFDDDKSILKFLDHVGDRYRQNPDAARAVVAERFRTFPSRKLSDVPDNARRITIPEQHSGRRGCPAAPNVSPGTLVGTVIGRALGKDGKPLTDVVRQEHYMEATLQISVSAQQRLIQAAQRAGGKQFEIPREFAQSFVNPEFLGQLDVNPSGEVPGSENRARWSEFHGRQVGSENANADAGTVRIRIEGSSNVEGGQDAVGNRTDGRVWQHRVTLNWYGFIDIKDQQVTQVVMLAAGDERLRWGNGRFKLLKEPDAQHLMAGHPIDLEGGCVTPWSQSRASRISALSERI